MVDQARENECSGRELLKALMSVSITTRRAAERRGIGLPRLGQLPDHGGGPARGRAEELAQRGREVPARQSVQVQQREHFLTCGVLRAHGGRIAEENRIRPPVSGSVRLSLTKRAPRTAPAQRPPRAHTRTHFGTVQDRDVALADDELGDVVEHQRGAVLRELHGSHRWISFSCCFCCRFSWMARTRPAGTS